MEPTGPDTRSRGSLNRERILEAAVRLIDEEGLAAVTMRRLATELGVGTMSLYTHVPNKEVLIDGVLGAVAAEIRLPGPEVTDPLEVVRAILREFRRVANLHPNLVPLLNGRPPATPETLGPLEVGFEALRRAGFSPREAVKAYRLTVSYALGFISLEIGGFFLKSAEVTSIRDGPGLLERFPRVVEAGPYLVEWDADAEFEAGVDILLSALQPRRTGTPAP